MNKPIHEKTLGELTPEDMPAVVEYVERRLAQAEADLFPMTISTPDGQHEYVFDPGTLSPELQRLKDRFDRATPEEWAAINRQLREMFPDIPPEPPPIRSSGFAYDD
jgi:hypothetical protein